MMSNWAPFLQQHHKH